MAVELVSELAAEAAEGDLERAVRERFDFAAVVADDVMVVVPAGKQRLIAGRVAEVEALDEAELRELVEGAVDACEPDSDALSAKSVEDLGRAGTAFLAG